MAEPEIFTKENKDEYVLGVTKNEYDIELKNSEIFVNALKKAKES